MSLFNRIFGEPEIRALDPQTKAEVKKIVEELVKIGRLDDFLSLTPGGPFDIQCHHRDAKQIGRRLNQIGGMPLMMAVRQTVKYKLKDVLAEHLDHCWKGIGDWQA
jgi:hypothetical protein